MPLDASTAPGALTIETGPLDGELLEKIVSGEVQLNFSHLPPRAIDPPIVIDPATLPSVDNLTDEQLLAVIDGLLDKLIVDPKKFPPVDLNKPPERVIYL